METCYLQLIESVKTDCPDMCGKCEYCNKFNWIIERAKEYSKVLNKPWENILEEWEKDRTFWYYNYYNELNQPMGGCEK